MGIKIRINVDGIYATENMLRSAGSRAVKMRPAMEIILDRMLDHEKELFRTSGLSVGRPWEPTDDGKGIGEILISSGRLMRSLTIKGAPEGIQIVTDSDIRFGSRVPYFEFHDKGWSGEPTPRHPIMFSRLQAREYYRIMQNYIFHGTPTDRV
jgi:phage gpG-like protein